MTRTSGSSSARLPRLVELLQELLADRVPLVGTVQPDPCDVSVDLVLDRLDLDCTGHERSLGVVPELKWL